MKQPSSKHCPEPFESWDNYDCPMQSKFEHAPWLIEDSATLIFGDGDITAFALSLADQAAKFNTYNKNYEEVLYFKSELGSEEIKFNQVLSQIPQTRKNGIEFITRKLAYYANKIQKYPGNSVGTKEPCIHWRVIHSKMVPWGCSYIPKTSEADICRELFYGTSEYHKLFKDLKFIFLDGFAWDTIANSRLITNLRNMIKQLKSRGITIIVISKIPPKRVKKSSIWDNVIEAKPWRAHKCGGRNITLNVIKCNTNIVNEDFRSYRLKSPKDKIKWERIYPAYYDIKENVKYMVNSGFSSKQILDNLSIQGITLPTLARLRRQWGIRTYRKKKACFIFD